MVNYPIGDALIRIKNAYLASQTQVTLMASNLILGVLKILKKEGYIKDMKLKKDGVKRRVVVDLKYNLDKSKKLQPAIEGIKIVSKPGRRVYVGYQDIPPVYSGIGINILSTSQGILTGAQAKKKRLGGELICQIW